MSSRTVVPAAVAFAAIFATLGVSPQANADVILDQSNPSTGTGLSGNNLWQQEVIAGVDGTLDSIDVYLFGTGTIDLTIYTGGSPWHTGTPDFAQTIVVDGSSEIYSVDVSLAGIPVLAGESFVLEFGNGFNGVNLRGTYDPGADYAGELWMDFGSQGPMNYDDAAPGFDIGFQTYVSTPAPAALAMFGVAGIGGFGGRRRRRA